MDSTKLLWKEIGYLISLQQEGGYWDFKRQWYSNKTDMLHDIICMANNLHNRSAYIIIGIDEANGYTITDVSCDSNRRNTQNIVDFLKDKKFAGSIRPVVHVDEIRLPDGTVDVIVVENSHNTPFYLTEPFEGVHANNIYTRIMDTNTPKDRTADINNVEYLWRKRFYIDEMPITKFEHYLSKPDDWEELKDVDGGYFYKYAPEYTIISAKDDRDGYEYYLFSQVNNTPSWWMVTLRYHQTAIGQFLGIALDGGRSFVIAPKRAYGTDDLDISGFGYYTKGIATQLLKFFYNKETSDDYSYRNYMKCVLVFNSDVEYSEFVRYVTCNKKRYHTLYTKIENSHLPSFSGVNRYNYDTEVFKKEYCNALVLQAMLVEFRDRIGMSRHKQLQGIQT